MFSQDVRVGGECMTNRGCLVSTSPITKLFAALTQTKIGVQYVSSIGRHQSCRPSVPALGPVPVPTSGSCPANCVARALDACGGIITDRARFARTRV